MSTIKSTGNSRLAKMQPARHARAVTPSNDDDLPGGAAKIYVGTGGDVAVIAAGDDDNESQIFKNVPDGSYLICEVRRVLVTGTDADDMLALYP